MCPTAARFSVSPTVQDNLQGLGEEDCSRIHWTWSVGCFTCRVRLTVFNFATWILKAPNIIRCFAMIFFFFFFFDSFCYWSFLMPANFAKFRVIFYNGSSLPRICSGYLQFSLGELKRRGNHFVGQVQCQTIFEVTNKYIICNIDNILLPFVS